MIDWEARYAARARGITASEIREILKLVNRPEITSFAGGTPDPLLFPRDEIAAAYARVLGDPARAAAALQYSVSEGYWPLREWLADYMRGRGVVCAAENILVTSGSQQALDFLGKLFITPGDLLLVSKPTYLGALQAFNAYEARYDLLPGPDNNQTVDRYASAGGAAPAPKFGYVMPEFQNPTGTSLSLGDRRRLIEIAHALDLILVEDAAYEQLCYDGEALPSLLALDAERAGGIDAARVAYCGTFSKTIVPGLRIGWIAAPRPVIEKLVLVKQGADLHTSSIGQMVMHEVASTVMSQRIPMIRGAYKARRDAMLQALAAHMPPSVGWTKPGGGMFVWMNLPDTMDAAALLPRAIAEAKVAYVPGHAFHLDGSGRNTLRLSFALNDEATIAAGVGRLGRLFVREGA